MNISSEKQELRGRVIVITLTSSSCFVAEIGSLQLSDLVVEQVQCEESLLFIVQIDKKE